MQDVSYRSLRKPLHILALRCHPRSVTNTKENFCICKSVPKHVRVFQDLCMTYILLCVRVVNVNKSNRKHGMYDIPPGQGCSSVLSFVCYPVEVSATS